MITVEVSTDVLSITLHDALCGRGTRSRIGCREGARIALGVSVNWIRTERIFLYGTSPDWIRSAMQYGVHSICSGARCSMGCILFAAYASGPRWALLYAGIYTPGILVEEPSCYRLLRAYLLAVLAGYAEVYDTCAGVRCFFSRTQSGENACVEERVSEALGYYLLLGAGRYFWCHGVMVWAFSPGVRMVLLWRRMLRAVLSRA